MEVIGDVEGEAARAERKRRQRQAQEEFRQRQLAKQKTSDDRQALHANASSSFERLLLELPSQDVEIEHTGDKREPPGKASAAKRRAAISRLDIVEAD